MDDNIFLKSKVNILIAEDDDDDYLLIQEALTDAHVINPHFRVTNGEELILFLKRQPPYEKYKNTPLPAIILLDLNMPKVDGRQALEQIRKDPSLRRLPVVILTTSKSQEDIISSYEIGANCYIRKPIDFSELIQVIKAFKKFWIEIVELPDNNNI